MGNYVFARGKKVVAKMEGVPEKTAWQHAISQKRKYTIWGTPSQVKQWQKKYGGKK